MKIAPEVAAVSMAMRKYAIPPVGQLAKRRMRILSAKLEPVPVPPCGERSLRDIARDTISKLRG